MTRRERNTDDMSATGVRTRVTPVRKRTREKYPGFQEEGSDERRKIEEGGLEVAGMQKGDKVG